MQGFVVIGSFRLDCRTRTLTHNGCVVALGPKVVETLIVLVNRRGELVTKAELMDSLWPDRCVEESNLSQNIYRLRPCSCSGRRSQCNRDNARARISFCRRRARIGRFCRRDARATTACAALRICAGDRQRRSLFSGGDSPAGGGRSTQPRVP